jgi:hypothetical protein
MKRGSRKPRVQASPTTGEHSTDTRGAVDRELTEEELKGVTGGAGGGGDRPIESISWGDGRKKPS